MLRVIAACGGLLLFWGCGSGCMQEVGGSELSEEERGEVEPIVLASLREIHEGSFVTSPACGICHSNHDGASAMRLPDGQGIAPFDLWEASMKANSARDPLFRAVLAAERAATPAIADPVQEKCLTCHAPMAMSDARTRGQTFTLEDLYEDTRRAQLGLDGVSCTTCHQLDPGTGTPETFSGQFSFAAGRPAFGPHQDPFARPMENRSGFTPVFSEHMTSSQLCASCHTLFTDAHTPEGVATGDRLLEQSPYLEWLNSDFNDEGDVAGPLAASCQDCHMPRVTVTGEVIRTAIARRPDGSDFPPIGPREPYGQHLFVGGNTLIPAILRDQAADLRPQASAAAFDAVIALAEEQLQEHTARLRLNDLRREGGDLRFEVEVENLTGHKIPTAYPSRRIWLEIRVVDAAGEVLFHSGGTNRAGQIVGPDGEPLPFELAGGPFEPHHRELRAADQVQIYESIMGDADGAPTHRLMRGATYLKDNRILPRGWSQDHEWGPATAPVGTDDDPSFEAGRDTLSVHLSGLPPDGTWTLEVALLYQTLSARYAGELFLWNHLPEVAIFEHYLSEADPRPVEMTRETRSFSP